MTCFCFACGQSVPSRDVFKPGIKYCIVCRTVMPNATSQRRYCSPDCAYEFYVVRHGGQCWEWHGVKSPNGYGKISGPKGRKINAHRFSYERSNGPVPKGMVVRHKCDNPPCTNPDHLEVGTHKDNIHDAIKRGRHFSPPKGPRGPSKYKEKYPRGSGHYASKLTDENVQEILAEPWPRGSGSALAKKFGVNKTTISYIRLGKKWQHVSRS